MERHRRSEVEAPTFDKLAGQVPHIERFKPTVERGKWFEYNDLNHSAMNVPFIDVTYVKFLTYLSLQSS
jgi:hypothetical protein